MTETSDLPELLTSREVADIFGVGVRTVSLWARKGDLEHIRTPGGTLRFRRDLIMHLTSPEVNGE